MSEPVPVASSGSRVAAFDMNAARPAPPIVAHLEHDRLIARDGAALPLRSWAADSQPRAVVLALHGFNDYSNAFANLGPILAKSGIATFAYDQRGFGAAPLRGRWPGAERMADDALTALRLLRETYPGVPVYLAGESMGGAIAILAANRASAAAAPDGVVLLAPAVWGRASMNIFERAGLWFMGLMPQVQWSPQLIPVRIRASDNIAMLRALGADPLVIKDTRSDTLNGLVDLMGEAFAAAPRFTARALILYGEHDEIVPRAPIEEFVAALPRGAAAGQRVALYAEGYHLLTRDLEGPVVISDIVSWIRNQSAPLPSGAEQAGRARLADATAPARAAPAAALPALRRKHS